MDGPRVSRLGPAAGSCSAGRARLAARAATTEFIRILSPRRILTGNSRSSPASDVWALGCICMEVATRTIPWYSAVPTNVSAGANQAFKFLYAYVHFHGRGHICSIFATRTRAYVVLHLRFETAGNALGQYAFGQTCS